MIEGVNMSSAEAPAKPEPPDMRHVWAGRRRSAARARAERAVAELEKQGHRVTLDPPLGEARP